MFTDLKDGYLLVKKEDSFGLSLLTKQTSLALNVCGLERRMT